MKDRRKASTRALGSLPALVAFIILLCGVFAVIEINDAKDARALYRGQVESCERVNVLRSVFEKVLEGTVRETANPDIRRVYLERLRELETAPFTPPGGAVVDCRRAVPKP
jgi:hypothetical protein